MPTRRPTLAFLLAAVLAGPAFAAPSTPGPATQPATSPAERRDRGDQGDPGDRDHSDRGDRPDPPASFSPDELAAAEAFYKDHAPGRFAWYEGFVRREGEDSDRVKAVRSRLVGRYRALQGYRKSNPKLYEFMLQQMGLEDAVRGAARKLAKSPDDPKLRDELRSSVRQLVENYLDAREARLEKLRADLAAEEADLKRDRANIDKLVDERVGRMMKDQ